MEQTHNNYYTRLCEQMKGDKTIVNFFYTFPMHRTKRSKEMYKNVLCVGLLFPITIGTLLFMMVSQRKIIKIREKEGIIISTRKGLEVHS